MQQDDQRSVAGLDVVQLHVADLGVALAKAGAGSVARLVKVSGVVVVMTISSQEG